MSIKRIKAILARPSCVAHELCHSAAARLLGLEAKRYRYNTVFYPNHTTDWRIFVVTLAPSLAGIAFFLLAASLAFYYWDIIPLILVIGFNVGWQAACFGDYYDLWQFFQRGYWEENMQELEEPITWRNYIAGGREQLSFNLDETARDTLRLTKATS